MRLYIHSKKGTIATSANSNLNNKMSNLSEFCIFLLFYFNLNVKLTITQRESEQKTL